MNIYILDIGNIFLITATTTCIVSLDVTSIFFTNLVGNNIYLRHVVWWGGEEKLLPPFFSFDFLNEFHFIIMLLLCCQAHGMGSQLCINLLDPITRVRLY